MGPLSLASVVTAPLIHILCDYTLPGKISFERRILRLLGKKEDIKPLKFRWALSFNK